MSAFTTDQLELLRRAHEGLPMWGGSVTTDRLRREVDLLHVLRLIEPDTATAYRLTLLGAQVVASFEA